MELINIQEIIQKYLPVRKKEKDKYGEVFTPPELINEILDNLNPLVWRDSTLKWLEPANGIGNFMMIVYERLMISLTQIPEINRSEHILQNMLYMIELNEKNVAISREIFGSKANIICGNFLENVNIYFGIDKFDLIIGNPPFNKEIKNRRNGGNGSLKLWDKFILKSLDILKNGGTLGFITPASWRAPPNNDKDIIYNKMTKDNHLKYLHIYSKTEGRLLFNVLQRVDLYIIEKGNNGKTNIIDEIKNKHCIDVKLLPFLPNYEYNEINSILGDGIDVIYSTIYHTQNKILKSVKTNEFKYPVVHSINEKGIVFWYANEKKGHFGEPKVILNFNEKQYNYLEQNDFEGKYGMSLLSFGIPITSKKQGADILKAINSDKFKEIIKATKWGIFQTDYRMFRYFKKDFYKDFHLI